MVYSVIGPLKSLSNIIEARLIRIVLFVIRMLLLCRSARRHIKYNFVPVILHVFFFKFSIPFNFYKSNRFSLLARNRPPKSVKHVILVDFAFAHRNTTRHRVKPIYSYRVKTIVRPRFPYEIRCHHTKSNCTKSHFRSKFGLRYCSVIARVMQYIILTIMYTRRTNIRKKKKKMKTI